LLRVEETDGILPWYGDDLGRRARTGEDAAGGPAVQQWRGLRRVRKRHVGARTSRTSVRRMVHWEGTAARMPRWQGATRAARHQLARDCVIVPLFECLRLQKFE
jgi:hypothetical protein